MKESIIPRTRERFFYLRCNCVVLLALICSPSQHDLQHLQNINTLSTMLCFTKAQHRVLWNDSCLRFLLINIWNREGKKQTKKKKKTKPKPNQIKQKNQPEKQQQQKPTQKQTKKIPPKLKKQNPRKKTYWQNQIWRFLFSSVNCDTQRCVNSTS